MLLVKNTQQRRKNRKMLLVKNTQQRRKNRKMLLVKTHNNGGKNRKVLLVKTHNNGGKNVVAEKHATTAESKTIAPLPSVQHQVFAAQLQFSLLVQDGVFLFLWHNAGFAPG